MTAALFRAIRPFRRPSSSREGRDVPTPEVIWPHCVVDGTDETPLV